MNNCGVCNFDVPVHHAQMIRKEADGAFTSYHIFCIAGSNDLKPCKRCGHHRKFCDFCAEKGGD